MKILFVKVVEENITKEKEVAIEGKLTNRYWDDKDGSKALYNRSYL